MASPRGLRPRVGFDALLLSTDGGYRSAGIHRYCVELLNGLVENDLDVVAFVADPQAREVLDPEVSLEVAPEWTRSPLGRIVFEQLLLPRRAAALGLDLVHGAAYALPAWGRFARVVTVHDLSFFRLPATLGRFQAAYLRQATRMAVSGADAVVAVSQFTARELTDLLSVREERLQVVHNGVDPAFRPLTDSAIEATRRSLGLPQRYILTVATLQPRKNLGTLVAAYTELRRRNAEAPDLVVVGAEGWGDQPDLRAPGVRPQGFVPSDALPGVYNGAMALALPSWYEGFGLPVIEAMACGIPTIVADAGALPEVAGKAALRVPPHDPHAWADALSMVCDDPAKRSEMRQAGLARAAHFSWRQAARQTAAIYRQVLQRPAHTGRTVEAAPQ